MERKTMQTACPICGSPVAVLPYFRNGAERVRKCSGCSGGFVFPRHSATELLDQYTAKYFAEKYDNLRRSAYVNMFSWENKIAACLDQVDKLRRGRKGLLLDVGCGAGWFLESAAKRGWQTNGVEPCAEIALQTMNRIGTQIHIGGISQINLQSEQFDLVTMFDVIEHLDAPVEALQTCYRILKQDGVLVISTPNFGGLGCRLLGARAFGIWPDEHIVYFSPAALTQALRTAQFGAIRISSREIYPENVMKIVSGMVGNSRSNGRTDKEPGSEIWSLKRLFRNNPVFRSFRIAMNRFFRVVPIGDELLAFAVKRG